jgi:hypothetical protein
MAVKCKMALNLQQRGCCMMEFHKTNSAVNVQLAFKRKFNPLKAKLNSICHLLKLLEAHHIFHVSGIRVNVDPPTAKSIFKWHRNLNERGCICDEGKGHSGRPSVSEQLSTR